MQSATVLTYSEANTEGSPWRDPRGTAGVQERGMLEEKRREPGRPRGLLHPGGRVCQPKEGGPKGHGESDHPIVVGWAGSWQA